MRIWTTTIGVLSAVVISSPAGLAAEHKCPPPGTEIKVSIASSWLRYEGQDGLWCLRTSGGKPLDARSTYFYAPDLGLNVKYEYRMISGTPDPREKPWELESIRSPQ